MSCGDVLYVPPKFGHEGTTLDSALTFSVGFLGPKMSDLFSGYAQYLSELEDLDARYVGNGLGRDSAGFSISNNAIGELRDRLARHLNSDDFTQWLVEFFTESSHEEFGNYAERDDMLSPDVFEENLKQGAGLIKPEYVKFAVTGLSSGELCLGIDSRSFLLNKRLSSLIDVLAGEDAVNTESHPELFDHPAILEFLLELYNHQALEFVKDAQ